MTPSDPGPDAYVDFLDAALVERAVQVRERRGEDQRRVTETASWSGLLVEAAELSRRVILAVAGGRRWRGLLEAVARDHVVLRLGPDELVFVVRERLRWLEVTSGSLVGADPRVWTQDRTLFEHLDRWLRPGDPLVVHLRDVPAPLSGVLVALGDDLLTIAPSAAAGRRRAVPASAIAEIVLPGARPTARSIPPRWR